MSTIRISIILALVAGLSSLAGAQVTGTSPVPGVSTTTAANLQIVSPRNNQKIAVDFVDIRYQIINPAVATNTTPTFQIQLDGGDAIHTSSTDHTFTGLAPGFHSIVVELVDANNTPIIGTRAEVHFVIAPPRKTPAPTAQTGDGGNRPELLQNASLQSQEPANPGTDQEPSGAAPKDNPLPSTGSALPLLSIIGFGVLVGGIASALKTR